MPEALMPPPKEALLSKPETPVRSEYAFYQIYPEKKNKTKVLNNGFEGVHLAVPFTPRNGEQRGTDGRQLAVGADSNDPAGLRLVVLEDVRPYDGLEDDRRNKAPNRANDVVVFERIGNKYVGFNLFEVTGQKVFKRVERGSEFKMGNTTLTVIGLDKKGDILFYKGKLEYFPEQKLPEVEAPEFSGIVPKFGTPPKPRFEGGFLSRKRPVTSEELSPVNPLPLVDKGADGVSDADLPEGGTSSSGERSPLEDDPLWRLAHRGMKKPDGFDLPGRPPLRDDSWPEASPRPKEEELRKPTGEEVDSETSIKVRRLIGLKLPIDFRLAALAALTSLVSFCSARDIDTIDLARILPDMPNLAPTSEPFVPSMPESIGPFTPPASLEEPIRDRWAEPGQVRPIPASIEINYALRPDYQQKIASGEGFSLYGLVQDQIAQAINPKYQKYVNERTQQGLYTQEDDSFLTGTLDALKNKLKEKYGEQADAVYDELLGETYKFAKAELPNANHGDSTILDGDKIMRPRFYFPVVTDGTLYDELTDLAEQHRINGNPLNWKPDNSNDFQVDFEPSKKG